MNCSPKKKKIFSSPTGVIEAWQHDTDGDGLPAIPDIEFQELPKQVRFSDAAKDIEPDWTRDDLNDVWWSKEEIRGFQQEARNKAKGFRETHTTYIQCLSTLFKECKNEPNRHKVLTSPSAQEVLWLSSSAVRGLEARLHPQFGKHRVVHVKKLLEVQHSMRDRRTTTSLLERSLRACARQTSRPSRAFAQLLAQGDHLQVAAS
jgi:hypothetical protein